MTATANASYVDSTEFSVARGSSSFFWTMIALAALDVVLLFWILNPLSKPSSNLPVAGMTAAQVRVHEGDKPSPLGAIATSRLSLRAAR